MKPFQCQQIFDVTFSSVKEAKTLQRQKKGTEIVWDWKESQPRARVSSALFMLLMDAREYLAPIS